MSEVKKAFDEYIENSPGVDEYAMELFNAQDRRIKELEKRIEELKYVLELTRNGRGV